MVGAAGGYFSGKSADTGDKAVGLENASLRTRSTSRTEGASAADSAKKSRAGSTEQIARLPGNSNRIQALLEFYSGLTPEQLAEEATKLEGLPMNERMMASFLLFGRWAEVDPTAAMAFSNTMGMAGGFVRPTILQSWASVDPANAAKYYAENPREFAMMGMMGRGPMGGQGGASIIASEWARQDPAAAMAWAASLTTEKGAAMNSVIGEIAKTDPRKAGEMISQMDPADRGDAYRSVAEQYGALSFSEAQTWIRTLPADEQAAARGAAIRGLSGNDPVEAAKQFASMEAGEAKNRIFDDVVENLARRDSQAAADLVKEQQDAEVQREGVEALMPTWTSQNPIAALSYANSFPPGNVRDRALRDWVMNNSAGSPAEVMKVAATIGDEGDRSRSMGVTAMRWMREDPEAAKEAIAASPDLSDEAKQRISEGRGMWGGRGRRQGGGGGD